TGKSGLFISPATALLCRSGTALRRRGTALHAWLLRDYPPVSRSASAALAQTGHWRTPGRPDRSGDSPGAGYGLRVGSDQHGQRSVGSAVVGSSGPAID